VLAACSTGTENFVPDNQNPPDLAKVTPSLKAVAVATKLQEPVEVSAPIRAPAISTIPWIICLRSGATEASKRLTYSVFYKNDEQKSYRLSAIIEGCDGQSYGPLK